MDEQYRQEELCQFFTSNTCSNALIAQIDTLAPRWIADVGAGHGSLAIAAMKRWGEAQLALFDKDPSALIALKQTCPSATGQHADFLIDRMPRNAKKWLERVDVILCNPPFREVPIEIADRWLAEAKMPVDWPSRIRKRAELVFLAHNLRMLRQGGELAMILPAAFINGHDFEPFRAWLLDNLTVTKVVQLPLAAFSKADVRAYAIIARKSPPSPQHMVQLIDLHSPSRIGQTLSISPRQGITRLDPTFHRFKDKIEATATLADTGARISRGSPVSRLEELGATYIHTTAFAKHGLGSGLKLSPWIGQSDLPFAKAGDVLLGRIGRNSHAQVLHVARGKTHFSDCIYRIDIPPAYRAAVLASLTDPRGVSWRQAQLRGSTVSLLSKRDLLQHPVWLEQS